MEIMQLYCTVCLLLFHFSPVLAPLCQTQHSLDSRPSSVSSMSSASWGNTAAAGATPVPGIINPTGRRGKLIYTPMILMDEATGTSQPLWSDGSASLPAGSRPGWYPGQTKTFTSMRMPPVSQGFIDKGSADSLVESVSENAAGDFLNWETSSSHWHVKLKSMNTILNYINFNTLPRPWTFLPESLR